MGKEERFTLAVVALLMTGVVLLPGLAAPEDALAGRPSPEPSNAPPVANAGPDRTVYMGAVVTFDAYLSSDDLNITGYEWTLEDGGRVTLVGAVATHRFRSPGIYAVTLTVRDGDGNVGTDTLIVTVRTVTLVRVTHSLGFRIGFPEGWAVVRGSDFGGLADFAAFESGIGTQPSVVVSSSAFLGPITDAKLLDVAQSQIDEYRQSGAPVAVTRPPKIVATVNARAAMFEIQFVGLDERQTGAVAGGASHSRLWTIIGTSDESLFDTHAAFFEAVIQSFELLPVGSGTAGLALVVDLSAATIAVVAVLEGLRRLRPRRREGQASRGATKTSSPGSEGPRQGP